MFLIAAMVIFGVSGVVALLGLRIANEEVPRSADVGDVALNIIIGLFSVFGTLASNCADLFWPDGTTSKHVFFCGGCLGCMPWLVGAFLYWH